MNMKKYAVLVGLAGLVLLILLLLLFPGFAVFGETLLFVAVILGLFWLFDSRVMGNLDTVEELRKGNIAYAIFLLAIALLFVAVAILVG